MRPDDLRQRLRRQPFRPFRLYVTDGAVYEIRHPEMLMVGRSAVQIGFPPGALSEDQVLVALLHITRLEPMVLG